MKYEKRKIEKADVRCVSSNYFSEECKKQTIEYIEEGYWVCFVADCIGHTRAQMFENDGEWFLVKTYGERSLQAAKDDWGTVHYRLR